MINKVKRVFNFRVQSTEEMLELMKKLGTFEIDLEAESRPGLVRVVAHGPEEKIKKLQLKIRELTAQKR
jgi:hypothetical protein